MFAIRCCANIAAVFLWGAAAVAQSDSQTEVPRGLWLTQANAGGIVYHVRTRGCGRALCGQVERVKNRQGFDAPSNAVGQMVFHNMRPQPDGSFFGEVRGRTGQPFADSRVTLVGNELRLRMCNGNECRDRVWKRLR